MASAKCTARNGTYHCQLPATHAGRHVCYYTGADDSKRRASWRDKWDVIRATKITEKEKKS